MRAPSRLVLEAYHSRVYSLLDYLLHVSDTSSILASHHHSQANDERTLHGYLLRDSDPLTYHDLMMQSLVAESGAKRDETRVRISLKISAPSSTMTEIIDRAHERLFARTRKPSNIITTGYRSAELRSEIGKPGAGGARHGVSNFFVNTLVSALQATEWSLLLKRVGDAILLHILTEMSVYIALPNDCYCQLTGPPLIYTLPRLSLLDARSSERSSDCITPESVRPQKRKTPLIEERGSLRPLKRRRKNVETYSVPQHDKVLTKFTAKDRSITTIPIARMTIFYARPQRRAKSGQVRLGLPFDHILNRMKTRAWRVSKGLLDHNGNAHNDMRPGDRDGALEARHFSKYVFPLQYRLENVFSIHPDRLREDQFARFRFMNREDELETKGTCKTPTRLKSILPMLTQLYRRHMNCGYKPLLDRICPSKLRPNHRDVSGDSSAILELISEEMSETLQTQMNFTLNDPLSISAFGQGGRSVNNPGAMRSTSRSQSQMKLKPKFAEFTCSLAEVYLYVCTISREVIPYALWGNDRNRRAVLHHVKQILSGRRHEGINLHNVMQGISTSECDWLLPAGQPSQRLNHSEAEMLKRRELLQEFVFWYFDQFLLPLLRTTFYITDSSAYRNRVLYFRQDDWDVLCQPLVDRMAATTFQRIRQHEAEDLLRRRKLGYSFVRLLPKDSGVRPIVNLRRKRKALSSNPLDQGQSINQILSAAFQILGYEKTMQAEKLGVSVFGPNEIYLRLKDFKKKCISTSGKIPKLYFVKVDVQACFDTIEQGKLLGILKELITEDVYMVQRHGQVIPSAGRVQRKFVKTAIPDHEHPHFLTYAAQLAGLLRHAILVDQVVYPFAFRDEIIQLLEDHITSNIVKIGKDYYRQRVGIPQGSVLSSLLCSFFYGDLERSVLRFVMDAERENVLLRLIDDYLFITTDMSEARHFLEVMNEGHPEYGCFIARDKTLTNFMHNVGDISQHSLSTMMHPDRKLFPWCGYLINLEDLSIMADYSRFHNTYLTDSLTVERGRRPKAAFVQKMLQIARAKTHAIFTDTAHNSSRAVRVNVYQAFVLTAMKMHAYMRVARHDAGWLAFISGTGPSPDPGSDEPVVRIDLASGPANRTKRNLKARKEVRGAGSFLLHVIRQCIRYTHASIRSKASGRLARESGGRCDLSKDEVIWLGTHAFHSVLSIKRTAYTNAGVLSNLHGELMQPRFNPVKRRLAGIARESLASMLRDIQF